MLLNFALNMPSWRPKKPTGSGTEWNTSDSGLCWGF